LKLPTHVVWFRDGRRLDLDRLPRSLSRLRLEPAQRRDYGLEVRLRVRRLSAADFGVYNCTAKNDRGVGSAAFHLVRRSLWERAGLSSSSGLISFY
jgi:hypothetical protein